MGDGGASFNIYGVSFIQIKYFNYLNIFDKIYNERNTACCQPLHDMSLYIP
jgi:hypothetical protein